jgi:excinuclease ABC subunit B
LIPDFGFRGFMASFELVSDFRPTGRPARRHRRAVAGFRSGQRFRTLEGVTGSGKTFTMAK